MQISLNNRKATVIKVLLFLFISLYCMPSLKPQAYSKEYKETDFTKSNPKIITDCEKLLNDGMDKSKIIGMSVAVVDEKEILWTEGFGYTDRNKKTKVNPDTIFSIQSISKSITSTAVMKAVQDGILDLDKPIAYYLPDFKVNSAFEKNPEEKITLRHLLSHTAGFTHEAPVGSNFDPSSPSFEEHIKSISNTWLKFPVGENYSYSNLGIDLAGYILQKQSEKPFYQYVDENIVKPVGMTNSSFDMSEIKSNSNRAVGHNSAYWKMPVEIPIIPSGGFYSSAVDMAKFIQFHINAGTTENKCIINSNYLNEMYKIPFPIEGQTEGYALGIGKGKASNTYFLNHNGGGFGFLSSMTWYPELKIGVIVLSNTATISNEASIPGYISGKILERIVQDPNTIYNSRLKNIKSESLAASTVTYNNLEENLISNITNKLSMIKSERKTVLTDYKKYEGNYIYSMHGIPFIIGPLNINIKNNNLYANNDILTEVKDGVFYMNSGEVLNLNKSTPTFRNIKLKKLPFGLVWYAIFIGICILSFISLPFIGLSKRKKTNTINNVKKQRLYKALLGLNILPFIAYIIFILYFYFNIKSLTSGTGSRSTFVQFEYLISILKYISLFVVIMLPTDIVLNILTWKNSGWSIGEKIHYSVITIFCIIFTMLLYYFNLILI